jgi:thiamine biosynthesis lipoprotein
MGTFVEVSAVCDSRDLSDEAIERAFAEMDRLIAVLSRHDATTPLSYLNQHGAIGGPPRELAEVLRRALEIHRRSGGAFDPTVKPLIDLLEASGGLPAPAELRDAVALVGAERVRIDDGGVVRFDREGMCVTLDGIAKGYIVDRMSEVLEGTGVTSHLVNAGGDIRTRGERSPGRAWTVAIEDPKKRGHYPDVLRMRDAAVATSGSYENYYDDRHTRHHIVDPGSGHSPLDLVSVSVRARTVMEADALSTAVFVLGRTKGMALAEASADVESLAVDQGGSVAITTGWSG